MLVSSTACLRRSLPSIFHLSFDISQLVIRNISHTSHHRACSNVGLPRLLNTATARVENDKMKDVQ
jgi:hypothetical protein